MKKKMTRNAVLGGLSALLVAGGAALAIPAANATDDGVNKAAEAHSIEVAPTDAAGDKVVTDTQDQVVKEKGEEGTLTDTKGSEVFSIKVNSVKAVDTCKVRGFGDTIKPANGTFLIVNVTASMPVSANKLVDEAKAVMPLGAEQFGVAANMGGAPKTGLNTEQAFSCDVENPLDFQVEGGHTATGNVVLDASLTHGQLTYSPEGEGGWTWAY